VRETRRGYFHLQRRHGRGIKTFAATSY
jgi:hypothetical protein